MTWWMLLFGGLGSLLILLFLGLPIFVAFLVLNVCAVMALFGPAGFGLFANSIFSTATNNALATVPLFIIMGEVLFRSGAMEAVFDALAGLVSVAATVVSDGIKYVLYLLNSALFALYRTLRDVLVLQAYSVPYTEQLNQLFGTLAASTLWRSAGNGAAGSYPHEELPIQREFFNSHFNPAVFPSAKAELPAVGFVAPYGPPPGARIPASPDAFLEAPRGPADMFQPNAPRVAAQIGNIPSFVDTFISFGGAIANSKHGIDLAVASFPGGTMLPDYNLDGDRGYAWPTWDVMPAPLPNQPPGDPLAPDAPANLPAQIATARAVLVKG
jgi:hypothetical protein